MINFISIQLRGEIFSLGLKKIRFHPYSSEELNIFLKICKIGQKNESFFTY